MHANDLIVNDGTAGQTVEGIAKLLPHFDREPAATLIIKAINSIDARTFVIAAKQKKVLGILDFVGKQEADHFQ